MEKMPIDTKLIARCGLYCGACSKYQKKKCPGCSGNESASWCKVRKCCSEKEYASCADCSDFYNVMECKKYNNFMAKLFGFIFNSDRSACIQKIKENGYDHFATQMAQNKRMTIKKRA